MGPVEWPPGGAVGAPDHPHRGFETVTYLLEGRMRHRDSTGREGALGPGDVQWMTAGSGVVHSEMPDPEFYEAGGMTHGFQLWVNLPSAQKMTAPHYQEIPGAGLPVGSSPDGSATVRVIAGSAMGHRAVIETRTPILFLHYTLQPGADVFQPVPHDFALFAYVFVGGAWMADPSAAAGGSTVDEGRIAVFAGDGDEVRFGVPRTAKGPAELLLLGGVPLDEPIARYGPFVMSTKQELEQAFDDYRSGRMGRIGG